MKSYTDIDFVLLKNNNKGVDHPERPVSLISGFVIHFLESAIPYLAQCKIARSSLVVVAEQAGMKYIWVEKVIKLFSSSTKLEISTAYKS